MHDRWSNDTEGAANYAREDAPPNDDRPDPSEYEDDDEGFGWARVPRSDVPIEPSGGVALALPDTDDVPF